MIELSTVNTDDVAGDVGAIAPVVPDEQPAPAVTVRGVGLLARLQLSEPVRLYLYPIAVAVIALLVAVGLVTDVMAPQWEALAAAVLGVGARFGIEGLRGSVVSPRTYALTARDAS